MSLPSFFYIFSSSIFSTCIPEASLVNSNQQMNWNFIFEVYFFFCSLPSVHINSSRVDRWMQNCSLCHTYIIYMFLTFVGQCVYRIYENQSTTTLNYKNVFVWLTNVIFFLRNLWLCHMIVNFIHCCNFMMNLG